MTEPVVGEHSQDGERGSACRREVLNRPRHVLSGSGIEARHVHVDCEAPDSW